MKVVVISATENENNAMYVDGVLKNYGDHDYVDSEVIAGAMKAVGIEDVEFYSVPDEWYEANSQPLMPGGIYTESLDDLPLDKFKQF